MVGIIRDISNRELIKIINPSTEWMIEQLENHVCQVFFRKRLNGQFRSIRCTRNIRKLPRKYKIKYAQGIQNPQGYTDIIPVWDNESRDWKSFHRTSVINFTVLLGV